MPTLNGKSEQPDINPMDKEVRVPARIVEALLVAEATSNRVGVKAVCQQIREAGQDQVPEVFTG